MEESQGPSSALSILLSRFKTLSKVFNYDYNCNLASQLSFELLGLSTNVSSLPIGSTIVLMNAR